MWLSVLLPRFFRVATRARWIVSLDRVTSFSFTPSASDTAVLHHVPVELVTISPFEIVIRFWWWFTTWAWMDKRGELFKAAGWTYSKTSSLQKITLGNPIARHLRAKPYNTKIAKKMFKKRGPLNIFQSVQFLVWVASWSSGTRAALWSSIFSIFFYYRDFGPL